MPISLPTKIIEYGDTPISASIIWLHGLGASNEDFVSIIPELHLPTNIGIRFIFPNAPSRPISINGGWIMPGWYDIYSLDGINRIEDLNGLLETHSAIQHLINQEKAAGISANRILLAGFSQGGAVTLFSGLQQPEALGGLIVLSAYLPCQEYVVGNINGASKNLPIFMAHGSHDDIVRLEWGQASRDILLKQNHFVNWYQYPMAHQVCLQEINDISQFIQGRLS